MSLGPLKVQANYPTIAPNTIIAIPTTPSTGNYTAGGEPCSLAASNLSDPNDVGLIAPVNLPIDVDVIFENGGGYYGQWVKGTTVANGKLQLFAPGGTEFSGSWATWNALVITIILKIDLSQYDQ